MHISFISMNRIVEEKAASDEEYCRTLRERGRVLLQDGRVLSDEALLARLRELNLVLDREQFIKLSQDFLSAEQMARTLIPEFGLKVEGADEDWVWIAFTCFWERWLPHRPSLEMIDDQMQAGYKLQSHDELGACRLWLATWKSIVNIMEARHLRSLGDFDDVFGGTNSLFNWVQDLSRGLHHGAVRDPSLWHERIALCETALNRLAPEGLLRSNFKNGLAKSYFAAGMPEQSERLYQQWLQADPQWGWGWISWGDCYFHGARREMDPARAERIWKEGLAVPGVADKRYLLERLAGLYEETGRDQEARALRAEIQALQRAETAVPARATTGHLRIKQTYRFGEKGLPVEDLGRFAQAVRAQSPLPGAKTGKTGRNAPCPCGSGKKFKRCCGTRS